MPNDTIEIFISYSKQDKELRDGLLSHLRPLEREGIITWHDRQILPGTEWDDEIRARLNAADIILLLISADFLATDYCTQVEIPEALRRHQTNDAIVMPVILRSCSWQFTPLAKIQAYPEKAKPIKSWTDIDEAYTNVVDGVYLAATEIKKRRNQQQKVEEQRRQQLVKKETEQRAQRERLQREQQRQAEAKELASEKGVDYRRLRDLLKAGQWREADQETATRMCEVMGQQQEGWLRIADIQSFPCVDLRTIDQLWIMHSKGRFGFSVQKKIWQACGSPTEYNANWGKFSEAVGWKKKGFLGMNNDWKFYSEFTFDISAPEGHLPNWVLRDSGGGNGEFWGLTYGLQVGGIALYSRRDL